ncbi:family 43 glycosylhydrolase [Demequina capsici]|uniref:Family 43 glycosylhydrolase n=1 Tax=Demequina capsici TaxID=3075620 RepID=A0AA96FEE5_9MICO|nr:family 43 glycosylhydrolase [Demequina sp. PMTSA13]WNM27086.1 family 43 glycosylhydrolase [Demequina sp. PMTSA13]
MGTYANPILDGCHPDPSVCVVDGAYHLVTSTFEHLPGLPIHRSTNLVDWELIGHVIDRPGQIDFTGIAGSKGLFAPTIRHHRGTWYVVCTHVPGDREQPREAGHFVCTATDPAGPWSDPTWLPGLPGIDPSLTFDGDDIWLCGTALQDDGLWDGQCDVWLTRLDPDSLLPIGEPTVLWRGALQGAGWAEGPHLVRRPDGGWMLVAAEGGTDRDHAVCVAYSDTIEGPYAGDPGNPRLTHRHLGAAEAIQNVGHADAFEAIDGRWWVVALATRVLPDGANSLCGRQTQLVPATWEDGRLVIAPGSGRVHRQVTADGVPDQAARDSSPVDLLAGSRLDPGWNGVRWHPGEFATLEGDAVVLTATPDEPTAVGRTAFLGRRVPTDECTLTATVSLTPGDAELRAGLLLRTSESAMVEVSTNREGELRVTTVDESETQQVAHRAHGSAPVTLTMRLRGHTLDILVDEEALATVDVTPLATGRPGWFMGSWWGPVAVGEGTARVRRLVMEP